MCEIDFGSLKFGSLSEKDWAEKIEPGTTVIVFPPNQEQSPPQTIDIYGLGIYEGAFVPPEVLEVGEGGITINFNEDGQVESLEVETGEANVDDLLQPATLNPRIRLLHNNVEVWGYECYWRPVVVDGINILVGTLGRGASIRLVDIEEDRAKFFKGCCPGIDN